MKNKRIDYYQKSDLYVATDESDSWMQLARQAAIDYSQTPVFPIGIVIVKDERLIVASGNGNGYHEKHLNDPEHKKGCRRRYISDQLEKAGKPKLKSGEGFELCLGCDTKYHAEARAIRKAQNKEQLKNATVYMYGHWWCCEDCWKKMRKVGIKKVCVVPAFRNKDNVRKWRNEYAKLAKK